MDSNIVQIILAAIAVLGGMTFLLRIIVKNRSDSTKTKQSGNIVVGDQAGRDIKK